MNNEILEEPENSPFKNLFYTIIKGIALIFCLGIIAGILESSNILSPYVIGIITGIAIPTFVLLYILVKLYKQYPTAEMSKKETLNRNILIGCGAIGGIIGVILVLVNDDFMTNPLAVFSNSPIPPIVAIILAALMLVVMPIIFLFWEKRATDEQEIYAYRTGAYYAAYAYVIGAPTWWILWRGGFTIEPNGMSIFIIFNFIWMGIWLWKKKYRG